MKGTINEIKSITLAGISDRVDNISGCAADITFVINNLWSINQ